MTDGDRTVFCFGVNGERRNGMYHPVSLYREGAENPYAFFDMEEGDQMIRKALGALPKDPEGYSRDEAGAGGWVRFDYDELVNREGKSPIQVENND